MLKSKTLTISNLITISRLVALPFIVYFLVVDQRLSAFIVMIIALASDGIDGYLARRLHQESELGKVLDPVCDKISLGVIVIAMIVTGIMPFWALVIVVRDLLILLGSYFVLKRRSLILTSNVWGKIAGVIFGCIILAFTLNWTQLGSIFLYLSIPAIILTFVIYAVRYLKVMKGV